MKLSEIYFSRHQGEWHWVLNIGIKKWGDLWRDDLSFFKKLQWSFFVFSQKIVGRYYMITRVEFKPELQKVFHFSRMYKFGITFFKSEKVFLLNPNGIDLILEGNEYYWPFLNHPIQFKNLVGKIKDCSTRANYEMPMLGIKCQVNSELTDLVGEINLEGKWVKGSFHLTAESMVKLQARIKNDKNLTTSCDR